MVNFVIFCIAMIAVATSLKDVVSQFKKLRNDDAYAIIPAAVITLTMLAIAMSVRVYRACDSAIWEIIPEFMHWSRSVARGANTAVVSAQWGGNPPAPKKAAKKSPPKAVKPISELPSEFPSFEARTATAEKFRVRWKAAQSAYGEFKFGTPEWEAGKEKSDEVFEALMKTYDIPVRY
jgi:hypothetical protein